MPENQASNTTASEGDRFWGERKRRDVVGVAGGPFRLGVGSREGPLWQHGREEAAR